MMYPYSSNATAHIFEGLELSGGEEAGLRAERRSAGQYLLHRRPSLAWVNAGGGGSGGAVACAIDGGRGVDLRRYR